MQAVNQEVAALLKVDDACTSSCYAIQDGCACAGMIEILYVDVCYFCVCVLVCARAWLEKEPTQFY